MHSLENPIWYALTSCHSDRAIGTARARRYRPDIAPFAAVQDASVAEGDLLALVEHDERICLLNVRPQLGQAWTIEKEILLIQMEWPSNQILQSDPAGILELGPEHVPDMLDLTGLVYPAYFRRGTAELGTYFGIYDGETLCAMAGTRMAMDGFREVSAVCTHPDYRGRGLAKRLMEHLIAHIQQSQNGVFLHTEDDNLAAQGLYRGMGFEVRARLPFWVLRRTG